MGRRLMILIAVALLGASSVGAAGTAPARPAGSAAPARHTPGHTTKRPAKHAARQTAKQVARKPGKQASKKAGQHQAPASATATRTSSVADSTARMTGGPRRLEDIHIEGEIPAPQVLFVTARDQRRFTRFHHQRYIKTSVQVGETTQLPTRIALTSHPAAAAGAP